MRKKKGIIICIICIFSCISYILLFKSFKECINDSFSRSMLDEKESKRVFLTKEQKLEDFEQFYNLICERTPFLEDSSEVYGIDFLARKEIYEDIISSSETDIDFYAAMMGIGREVCSFHTSILFPKYDYLSTIRCDNNEIIKKRSIKEKQDVLEEEIKKESQKYKASDFLLLREAEGHYYIGNEILSDSNGKYAGLELSEINGQDPAEFFMQGVFLVGIQYDPNAKRSYRSSVFINKAEGEPIEVVWKDAEGNTFSEQLYYSIKLELIANYGYMYNSELAYYPLEDPHDTIYYYSDKINELEYIRIRNFDEDEKKLRSILADLRYDDVIIDLRNNKGGIFNYGVKNIYTYLYSEDDIFFENWKRTRDSIEKDYLTRKINRIKKVRSDDEFNYYSRTIKGTGCSSYNKNVVILTDNKTGSAADFFVGIIKEKKLGTIIGDVTGGEGKSGTMTCEVLNNSGILFTYYPSVPCDEIGNSLYYCGTEPDIYVSWNKEDYEGRAIFLKEGTAGDYSNMLTFDPVLNEAVSFLKK